MLPIYNRHSLRLQSCCCFKQNKYAQVLHMRHPAVVQSAHSSMGWWRLGLSSNINLCLSFAPFQAFSSQVTHCLAAHTARLPVQKLLDRSHCEALARTLRGCSCSSVRDYRCRSCQGYQCRSCQGSRKALLGHSQVCCHPHSPFHHHHPQAHHHHHHRDITQCINITRWLRCAVLGRICCPAGSM
jgi:hypothetical protein